MKTINTIIKNFKILLIVSILAANGILFAMHSCKEASVNEETIEDTLSNLPQNKNQDTEKPKKLKNYQTSNWDYYRKLIDTGDYRLEFEKPDIIKISRDRECTTKSEGENKRDSKSENKRKSKNENQENIFIKLKSQKNALSLVLASEKINSPYILVFTQKFKFTKQNNPDLDKQNFCEIMKNPENIVTIYNTKTGKPVKVLSDILTELRNKRIYDLKFLKSSDIKDSDAKGSDIVGFDRATTYDVETGEIYTTK